MIDDNGPDSAPFEGEVTTTGGPAAEPMRMPPTASNPFARGVDDRTNAGAVAVEQQRAIAEVQGRMVVAKRFPRDPITAYATAMQACARKGMADQALYSFPRGGKTTTGASIRLAEELARLWGNIEYGINELSRVKGSPGIAGASEMEAFAWDLETNTRSSQKFTVAHIRDKNTGTGDILTAERDIYELTANMGSRRVRARILAILPPELVDDAETRCRDTIKHGAAQSLPDTLRTMAVAFQEKGVSAGMLQAYLGKAITDATLDECVELRGIYQAIKDGTKASEFFSAKQENGGSRLDKLEQATTKPQAKTAPQETTAPETKSGAAKGDLLGEAVKPWRISQPKKKDEWAPNANEWVAWWNSQVTAMESGNRALALRELMEANKAAWAEVEATNASAAGAVAMVRGEVEQALAKMAGR